MEAGGAKYEAEYAQAKCLSHTPTLSPFFYHDSYMYVIYNNVQNICQDFSDIWLVEYQDFWH